MAIFSLALNSTVTTTGASAMDLLAGTNSPKIMQIGMSLGVATASTYGLGRAGNTPVQTSGVALLAEGLDSNAALSKLAVAWGTAPTVPANFFRRIGLPATVGAGVIWGFSYGLAVATATAMEFWNLATNGNNINVYWVVDE